MKQFYLTALILIGINAFSQTSTTNLKIDTISYNKELIEFYQFLNTNYDHYINIDFNNKESISILKKECENILEIIHSKTKYIENTVYFPVQINATQGSYYYFPYDCGGKNYPKIYEEIADLHRYAKKILKTSNKDKLNKLNLKLISVIDQILNKTRK